MTDYDAMHCRCREFLAQLDVRPPVPLRTLVEAVARVHGRPITLAPADLPVDAAFGATRTDDTGEVIFYQRHTVASHQLMIVLHELAHILAEHPRKKIQPTVEDVRDQLTMLPESMLHLVLGDGGSTPVSDELDRARPGLIDEPCPSAQRAGSTAPSAHPDEVVGSPLYDDVAEWEAKVMGTIMLSWLTDRSVHPVTSLTH